MLVKPWNEAAAPRHFFEDDEDKEVKVPSIEVTEVTGDSILIIPNSLRVIAEQIPKEKVGEITIKYEVDIEEESEEYDEDEQLYSAMKSVKYTDYNIPIYKSNSKSKSQSQDILMIIMPHITNTIVINQASEKLASLKIGKWVSLSPSNILPSLSKLGTLPGFNDIPNIQPPHFITGISASVSSKLYKSDKKFMCLILRGEGQPGYEIIDSDAIVDCAYILQQFFNWKDLVKSVSSKVRKFSYNSGMYI